MTEPNTSSIFTVWRTLQRLLTDVTWPASSSNPGGVVTYFGDPDLMPNNLAATTERVVVASGIGQPDESWATNGRYARNENFVAYVYAVTAIPGRTSEQARDRLEEITVVIERFVRTINTGRVAATSPDEFDPYPVWFIEVDALNPLVTTGPQGAIGKAEIGLRCSFRIGTPPVE
jgi:hypothetical protein